MSGDIWLTGYDGGRLTGQMDTWEGRKPVIVSAASLENFEEVKQAILNGYPIWVDANVAQSLMNEEPYEIQLVNGFKPAPIDWEAF